MISFKNIEASEYGLFKKHIDINKFLNSEYSFSTFFCWQHASRMDYTIIENCICVRGDWQGESYYYFPLGEKNDIQRAIIKLMDYCKSNGKQFILMNMSGQMIEYFEEFGLDKYFIKEARREFFDYVYKREKLITLSGKKLHGKRNHFNYFVANYDYSLEDITPENEDGCREMLKRSIEGRSEDVDGEISITMNAFDNRDEINLISGALMANGKVAGVILTEDFYDMPVIQIAKADTGVRGAPVALFKLFFEKKLTSEYVNFMDDMGIEGLRQAKMSYAPDFFIEKYVYTLNLQV